MKQILPFGLFMLLFLTACAGAVTSQPAKESKKPLEITVFRSPA